jgi:hypothetical protein
MRRAGRIWLRRRGRGKRKPSDTLGEIIKLSMIIKLMLTIFHLLKW